MALLKKKKSIHMPLIKKIKNVFFSIEKNIFYGKKKVWLQKFENIYNIFVSLIGA